MDQSQLATCIYCPSTGPFSDEHVFPAGMGGDDSNFLLVNSVCKNCNTGIFSKLELSLMRRSPIGLGRKFLQTKTREKGSRTSSPTIEAKTYFILDESGRSLEAEYDKSGAETILAQLIIEDKKVYYTAGSKEQLENLYSSFLKILEAPKTHLITKLKTDNVLFNISTFEWVDDTYILSSTETLEKPPKTGIWLETSLDKTTSISPRFYQRLAGQLNLRAKPDADYAGLLRSMRRTLPSMRDKQGDATESLIDNPIIHMEMIIDTDGTERALAKIGVNFLTHTFGKKLIARPEFQDIKNSILTGTPQLPLSSFGTELEDAIMEIFGNVPKHCHCVMLLAVPSENGLFDIYFNARLYGAGAHKVLLGKNIPLEKSFYPIYFLINYEENSIKKMSMLEYQSAHGILVKRFLSSNQT